MTLVDELSAVHRELPGCRAVVFGDMQTGTVFWASADGDLHQEDHDALLEEASAYFSDRAADLVETALGGEAARGGPSLATVFRGGTTGIFLRPGAASEEVVCLAIDGLAAVDEIAPALRRILSSDA